MNQRRPIESNTPRPEPSIPIDANDPELLEKLVEHFTNAVRAGRDVPISRYAKQYPQHQEEIHELLSSVAMIEQLKTDTAGSQVASNRQLDQATDLKRIGNYTLIREIGRGGMGVVFEARHDSLGRRVAIKVMPTPLVNGDSYVQRFRHEAQAAAKLHHTNIVSVFGVGQEGQFHYYVMDYVDGQSLSDFLRSAAQKTRRQAVSTVVASSFPSDAAASPYGQDNLEDALQPLASSADHHQAAVSPGKPNYYRWCAKLGSSVADALGYAHEVGILHRDIKPANLILGNDGIVWITDFGLAKDSDHEIQLTRTGDVLGTPQYLAPESLEGRYDARSEIYCLGLTLYELVCQQPAYPSGSPAELIRRIATSSPAAINKVASNVPRDLSTIISKCLSREPAQRYASANALRNDLQAFVEDRPIAARRPSLIESTRRWARQNPWVAGLSLLSFFLLAMVAVVASAGYVSTAKALDNEADKSARLLVQQRATERARQDAEANLQEMKLQYERADANVALTLEAFDELFKQVIGGPTPSSFEFNIDGLREMAGIETGVTQREAELLGSMLGYYEKFASQNQSNSQLTIESARAYRRVGNIYQLVGEMPDAIEAYQKSLDTFAPIWEISRNDKEALQFVVGLKIELASAMRKNNNPRLAYAMNEEAIELLQQSSWSENDPDVRLTLARALLTSGFNLFRFISISPQSTIPTFASDGDRPGLPSPRSKGNEPTKRMRLIPVSWTELERGGRSMFERRNRQMIQQAELIVDDLLQQQPDNAEYRAVKATCQSVLATTLINHKPQTADRLREQSVDAFSKLVAENPDQSEYRYLLALACAIQGASPDDDDQRLLNQAIGQAETLINNNASRLEYHQLSAALRIKMASLHLQQQRPADALESIVSAKESFDFLVEREGNRLQLRRVFGLLKNSLADVERQFREQNQIALAEQASQIHRRLSQQFRKLPTVFGPFENQTRRGAKRD